MQIAVNDLKAFFDGRKAEVPTTIDQDIAKTLSVVVDSLSTVYDSSAWLMPETTPDSIRALLAMYYSGWWYLRTYADDTNELNNYGLYLVQRADALLDSLVSRQLMLPGIPLNPEILLGGPGSISFYPNDNEPKFVMNGQW